MLYLLLDWLLFDVIMLWHLLFPKDFGYLHDFRKDFIVYAILYLASFVVELVGFAAHDTSLQV